MARRRVQALAISGLVAMAVACVVLVQLSAARVELEKGAETYSITSATPLQFIAPQGLVRHYPDPQGMPNAFLIKSTIDTDSLALNRILTKNQDVRSMEEKAHANSLHWRELLSQARMAAWRSRDELGEVLKVNPAAEKPGDASSTGNATRTETR